MNILLLTHGIPFPPDSGPRVKTYHLLRHLAERHRVTLVCLVRPDDDEAHAAGLHPFCAAVHTLRATDSLGQRLAACLAALLGRQPFTVARHASGALHALLARLVAQAARSGQPFDVVHADQLVMAQFAERLAPPRLFDAHNAVWRIYEAMAERHSWPSSWIIGRETQLLRAYEGRICSLFEATIAVNDEDRQALLEAAPAPGEITVVPIGVDGAELIPVPRSGEPHVVLSLSTPAWPPNAEGIAWFTREVYPLVRRAVPDARLSICGAQPIADIRALANEATGVEVPGFVNLRPYLEQAGCMIAPLRSSGGMRVMLLEALARGLPTVATSLASADLDLVSGEHLLVADTPSEFADAVALLLRDPELGARLALAGRQRMLERYDWRVLYPAVDVIYARLAWPELASATLPGQVAPLQASQTLG